VRTFAVLREFRPGLGGTPYVAGQAARVPGPERKPRRTRARHYFASMCQLDGDDRRVPFDLAGVPQITDSLAGQAITPNQSAHLKRIIRRATAELRRRYEQHNERALAELVAREAEEDAYGDY
jgi:hypothetical protein